MALYAIRAVPAALTAEATKSLILARPEGVTFKIRQIDISLAAKEAAEEVLFDLYRASVIGTPEGTAAGISKLDAADETASTTALTTLTKEPTTKILLDSWYLQPLGGLLSLPFPFGAEPIGRAKGERIGLQYTTLAGVKPNCAATFWIEE